MSDAAPQPTITATSRAKRGLRVFVFFSAAVLLTGFVTLLFADLLWRTGWSTSRTVLLVLFIILFFLSAIGCVHGVFGFFARLLDSSHITNFKPYKSQDISSTSTAILLPIYNEDVARVCEGLRATYESLERTGHLARFDFFILSDSTDPDVWIEEERRWCDIVRELDALGRIFYRRRVDNEGKKHGNVRDFLSTWGQRYRYFVCFDADSVMRGETLVDLVKLIEANPGVGLIQTMPALINARSLFGRIQQFANRLYAPIFISGLNFWAQGFGNYWGHNAIIRTEAFMQNCDLPHLPGRKPFGGQILSHDFVEAALLLREGWQVWFAHDLEGSYEEAPQGMIENAQRDRRWCQGNLQHGLVLFFRGLRSTSRIHLLMGIFGYLASPLWLLFLLTYNWIRWSHTRTGLSEITISSQLGEYVSYLNINATAHAFLIFVICMAVLMLPKVLALVDLAREPKRRREFGGLANATGGAVAETLFSTLHAPLQMLWHSHFVVTILAGTSVNWGKQNRDSDGTTWGYALRHHWGHVAVGVLWGGFIFWTDRTVFWWFTPVLAGMIVAPALSVYTSRSSLGERARSTGLFLTPEETSPPPELISLHDRMTMREIRGEFSSRLTGAGIAEAVLDPYVNAIHVSLLREKKLNPVYAETLNKLGVGTPQARTLAEKLLNEGPEKMSTKDKLLVLSDEAQVLWLHHQAWLRPTESLAAWWQPVFRRYS